MRFDILKNIFACLFSVHNTTCQYTIMNVGKWSFTPLEINVLFNNGDLFQEKRKISICFGAVELRLKVYVKSVVLFDVLVIRKGFIF